MQNTTKTIDIDDYRVVAGPDNGLMQIMPSKHPRAMELFNKMREDHWDEKSVDMSTDVQHWPRLTPAEQRGFMKALAFLSNLDGLQLNNLSIVSRHLTSPWYRIALSRQIFDEAVHVMGYSLMIETLGFDPEEIYNMFINDELLHQKNQYVRTMNVLIPEGFSVRNFALATVANQALEGIMFQSGFLFFYVLAENKKMPGSAKQIRYIHRDENNHLRLFNAMYKDVLQENPEIFDADFKAQALNILKETAELEKEWGAHILGTGIMGCSVELMSAFVEYLTNSYAAALGLPKAYPARSDVNPCPFVEERADDMAFETNFFENERDTYDTQVAW